MPEVGRSYDRDSSLLQEYAVVKAKTVADTLYNVAGEGMAAGTDVVAGPGTFFAAENESGCEER